MMEVSLERLAEVLERVRRMCPHLAVWAIRWMYLKHPLHPIQKALMRGEGSASALRQMPSWFWLVSRCVWYAGSLSVRLVFLRVLMRRELPVLKRQSFDLVARTCCRGTHQLPDGRDFYYGDLHLRLAQRHVRMLLLCGDVLDSPWRTFAKSQVAVGPVWKLPELCLVNPLAPIHMLWNQLLSARRLSRLARRLDDPLTQAVATFAARDCLLPDTTFAALTFWAAKAAVRTWHPRAFLTFYEGHAWERCVWWGVKTADASCRTVGYQHAMVFRESLSLVAPSVDGYGRSVPDIVLCLGQAALELLRAGHAQHSVQLLRFGSFRHLTSEHSPGPQHPNRRTVLVTPEGIVSETGALFAFAAACARRLPAYTFILRMFPGTTMPGMMQTVKQDLAQLPNLVLSDRADIQDDYKRSSIIMYRGSSSVLYGTLKGLLPVYVHIDSLVDADPLYMLTSWRRRCATPEEFTAIVEAHEGMPDHERAAEWDGVAAYLRQYVEPVGEGAIEALLASVGVSLESREEEKRWSVGQRRETASLKRLAEALGTVKRLCPELPVFAIRWMYLKHPLRPIQEALLRGLVAQQPRPRFWRQIARCALYAVYLSGHLWRLRVMMRRDLATLRRRPFDLVVKTCCLGVERSADGRDFYYGDLQQRMTRRGVKTLFLCGDIFGTAWRVFASSHTDVSPSSARLPELCLVTPDVPIRLLGQQLSVSRRLQRLARAASDPLVAEVCRIASVECLAPDTTFAALTFWVARNAVRLWHPKAFVTFYEGHAWERCAWWGVKAADLSCQTVGYQHTMIFRESLTVTQPTVEGGERSLPDIVLTLGDIPLEVMRPMHEPHRVRMVRFGSFRTQWSAAEVAADPSRRTILVTPEGHEPDCSTLFAFAYACARLLPAYLFILRMQPGVSLPEVRRTIEGYEVRQPNIVLSDQRDIADDFARSSIVMYRGSSTVLYATLAGLLPVYVRAESLVDTDPLYGLTAWRRTCGSPEEFVAITEESERMLPGQREAEWRIALDYLKRYVVPVESNAVDALLESVGMSR